LPYEFAVMHFSETHNSTFSHRGSRAKLVRLKTSPAVSRALA